MSIDGVKTQKNMREILLFVTSLILIFLLIFFTFNINAEEKQLIKIDTTEERIEELLNKNEQIAENIEEITKEEIKKENVDTVNKYFNLKAEQYENMEKIISLAKTNDYTSIKLNEYSTQKEYIKNEILKTLKSVSSFYGVDNVKGNYKDIIIEIMNIEENAYENDITNLLNTNIAKCADSKNKLLWPVPYDDVRITSKYGYRILGGAGQFHKGLDISRNDAKYHDTFIVAAEDGEVVFSGSKGNGYGNYLEIKHSDSMSTRYAHCYKLLVEEGEMVTRGQPIAIIGSTGHVTGPHLHFEVLINDEQKNPENYLAIPGNVCYTEYILEEEMF